nr:hypothetical protein [Faustovirus mariensis]
MSSVQILEDLIIGSNGWRLGGTLQGLNLSELIVGDLTVTTINGQPAANIVFSNTTQTITGSKTFTSTLLVNKSAGASTVADPTYILTGSTNGGAGTTPVEIMFQNKVTTTGAATSTVGVVTIPANTTVLIQAFITGRRTGGSAGTAEDGGGFIWYGTFKNIAGTATVVAAPSYTAMTDQAAWVIGYTIAAGDVNVNVTGSVNNNVAWTATLRYWISST